MEPNGASRPVVSNSHLDSVTKPISLVQSARHFWYRLKQCPEQCIGTKISDFLCLEALRINSLAFMSIVSFQGRT